jgi:hypothetical protein
VQSGFYPVDDQRMARVMSALKPHHTLRKLGQPIDQLSLTFIAPLGSDDDDMTTVLFAHGDGF